jgi:hypothetical protein
LQCQQEGDISDCATQGSIIEMMPFGFANLEIVLRLIGEVSMNT